MKNAIAKILPIVVGVALGWLMFHPPAWLAPLGALRFFIMIALALVLLVVFIAFSIGASLPAEIGVSPQRVAVDPSLNDLIRQIKDLGFAEAGGPYRVEVRPAAIMIAFVHPGQSVYATIFRTGTVPAVTSYDFVSIIEGFRGGLTTSADWRGGTLPAGPGAFRQIIKDAGPRRVYDAHLEGLRWLSARGLPVQAVSATSFVADFKRALGKQRQAFRSSPLKNALIALGRTVSKQVPHIGPLSAQKGAEAQVRALWTR